MAIAGHERPTVHAYMEKQIRRQRFATAQNGPALAFLVDWRAIERAARLVRLRIGDIDGNRYELLDPAAAVLEGRYPLAAVLLRRALIEFTLQKGRTTRYKHAARHVREIDSLNAQIKDYAGFETHEQFTARLLRTHSRKTGFWSLLRD